MIKLLIGGSPCTYWSIAQTNHRETTASGMGWELFKNYLIAKEKFKPDFFLYENNKSAAQEIKDQIKKELGVFNSRLFGNKGTDAKYIEINSALVSAQNRQRFYVHNCGNVQQPEDRGILLKDILENGVTWRDKSHTIDANYFKGGYMEGFQRQSGQRLMVAEPIDLPMKEPVHLGSYGGGSQGQHIYGINGKSITLTAQTGGMGGSSGLYAYPARIPEYGNENKSRPVTWGYSKFWASQIDKHVFPDKPNKQLYDVIVEPINITPNGKSQTLEAQYAKNNVTNFVEYTSTYGATGVAEPIMSEPDDSFKIKDDSGKELKIYSVKDGKITIKNKEYPINLPDGYYIIRKLSVKECCRLQTMPDDYCRAVSDTQAYKGLGNGWTAEVIIHILSNALKDIPRDEEIVVLSMYDGISTGRYCLDKMGFTNVKYYAYEIDKYAMQVSASNYPDIIQLGDAFAVREEIEFPWLIL